MSRINGALYPFGYGLSYTTFEYSDLDITQMCIRDRLTTRLRGEMGFRGYVVSDSDAVEYLYTKHGDVYKRQASTMY